MPDTTDTRANIPSNYEISARLNIGRHVIYFSISTILIISCAAIVVSIINKTENDPSFGQIKEILMTVLPLLGTWVGTVMAFYFSRENFISAATQTSDLVHQLTPDQKLQSIKVTEVMLDISSPSITKLTLNNPQDAAKLKLQADIVATLLEKNKRNRLPILDADGKILYIIHRSKIDEFLVKSTANPATPLTSVTLQDLLADPELKSVFQSFATLGENARLSAVKQGMNGNPNCSDTFITKDGTKGSKALGWITNIIVQEKLNG